MTQITDEFMKQMLVTVKNYTVVILKPGPQKNRADAQSIKWEHGRKNFVLRAEENYLLFVLSLMEAP